MTSPFILSDFLFILEDHPAAALDMLKTAVEEKTITFPHGLTLIFFLEHEEELLDVLERYEGPSNDDYRQAREDHPLIFQMNEAFKSLFMHYRQELQSSRRGFPLYGVYAMLEESSKSSSPMFRKILANEVHRLFTDLYSTELITIHE